MSQILACTALFWLEPPFLDAASERAVSRRRISVVGEDVFTVKLNSYFAACRVYFRFGVCASTIETITKIK